MDLSHIATPAEAEALMQAVAELYQRLQQAAADTDAARRARIGAAVKSLTALLGPDQPSAAGQGSIREMRLYPDARPPTARRARDPARPRGHGDPHRHRPRRRPRRRRGGVT